MPLPSLLRDYQKYLDIENKSNQNHLDLTHIRFVSPSSLLPALYLARSKGIKPTNIDFHDNAYEHGLKILGLTSGNSNMMQLMTANIKKYTDTENNRILYSDIQRNRILSHFDTKIREFLFKNNRENYVEYGNEETFPHITGEMLSNVDQHSDADRVYCYGQIYPIEGYAEVGILDDGISIPQKYEQSYPEFIGQEYNPYDFKDDCDAIRRCLNGISTKISFKRSMEYIDSPSEIVKNDNLGMGFNTTIRVVTEGLGGSFLIASRGGICHLDSGGAKFIKVDNDNKFKGTFICARFKKVELSIDEHRAIIEKFSPITDEN